MTKEQKNFSATLIPFIIALVCFWYIDSKNEMKDSESTSSVKIDPLPKSPQGSSVRSPASVSKVIDKAAIATGSSHPVWQENLERTLRTQGGSLIKNIEIEKVDSFDWKVGKVDVRVDSIKVSLQNEKGQRSSFRAIVDASSGKILQTWDQPIIDNFSAKIGGTIKIDSRYHND